MPLKTTKNTVIVILIKMKISFINDVLMINDVLIMMY